MTAATAGLLVAVATLVLTLLGIVWKGATIAGEMHAGLAELRATVAELKEGLKQLAEVPVLRIRVTTLENITSTLTSKYEAVHLKLFSHDKHIAVHSERIRAGSSPDLTNLVNASSASKENQ